MIEKKKIYIPCFKDIRILHIYLPKNYNQTHHRYPVLYMFDGHNLFYDEDATYGKCWGLKKWLDCHNSQLIVVGLECNHIGNQRLEEFSPYDFSDPNIGHITGRGKELFKWITSDLKHWVDHTYRTLPDVSHTAIGGSSMGGLMALYGILSYPNIYSKAAVLSPFVYYVKEQLAKDISQCSSLIHHDIYLSWGSDEFSSKQQLALASSYLVKLLQLLLQKSPNVYPNLVYKGKHNEESWEKELDILLPWLFRETS